MSCLFFRRKDENKEGALWAGEVVTSLLAGLGSGEINNAMQ